MPKKKAPGNERKATSAKPKKAAGAAKPKVAKKRQTENFTSLELNFRQVGGTTTLEVSAYGGVTLTGLPSVHPTRKVPVVGFVQFASVGTNEGELHGELKLLDSPERLAWEEE